MKTFFSDIIPKLQRFSVKLDNSTLLTNQHWVVLDDILDSKVVYIFRSNNDLLISNNGKVQKAKWEYLGNNSLLIETNDQNYLFKHGFFDENILALKVDSKQEYAFLVNENKFAGEINSLDGVNEYLKSKYTPETLGEKTIDIDGYVMPSIHESDIRKFHLVFHSSAGRILVEIIDKYHFPQPGQKVFINDFPAPNGKYKIGFLWYIHVHNGKISVITMF